jgi:hypothetical protein
MDEKHQHSSTLTRRTWHEKEKLLGSKAARARKEDVGI